MQTKIDLTSANGRAQFARNLHQWEEHHTPLAPWTLAECRDEIAKRKIRSIGRAILMGEMPLLCEGESFATRDVGPAGHLLPDLPTIRKRIERRNVWKGYTYDKIAPLAAPGPKEGSKTRTRERAEIRIGDLRVYIPAEYKDTSTLKKEVPADFAPWVRKLGNSLATAYVNNAMIYAKDLAWQRSELAIAATSSLCEYVAKRYALSPRLATLRSKSPIPEIDVVLGVIPLIRREAIRLAFHAMDRAQRKMAMELPADPSYFSLYDETDYVPDSRIIGEDDWTAPEHTHGDCRSYSLFSDYGKRHEIAPSDFVTQRIGETRLAELCAREKIATLLDRVNAAIRATDSKRRIGHLRSVRKLLLRAYRFALCAIRSRAFTYRTPLSFHAQVETVTQTFKTSESGHTAQRSFRMSTGKIISNSALWQRARTLGTTLGVDLTPNVAKCLIAPRYVAPRNAAKDRREFALARFESGQNGI